MPKTPQTVAAYTEAIRTKKTTIGEALAPFLENAQKRNSALNIYLELFSDIAEQTNIVEERLVKGEAPPLLGVPIAIKDNILIKGKKATCASKILEGYVAPYDATVITKLRNAGAIFIGRTNMDEFAMGGSTENSAFGVTKNPHDEARVAGGSSGGSAAAVSAGMALVSLGSDTGGSIREPASFCGIVGFKPTYGTVSRHGLVAMASSLDQIGPFAHTTEDAELLFSIICGKDIYDATSREYTLPKNETKQLRLAYPKSFLEKGVDADVLENFYQTLAALKEGGAIVEEVDMPALSATLAMYYIIMPAEASSNLARFDGIRFGAAHKGGTHIETFFKTRGAGFGKEVRRRIMLGTYVLSSGYYDAYYQKALTAREGLRASFTDLFKNYDALLMPTSPTPAFKIGEKASDPLTMYLADIFTVSANLAGVPAISVPSGNALRDGKQLPLGIQALGPWFREDIVFSVGKKIEEVGRKNEKK